MVATAAASMTLLHFLSVLQRLPDSAARPPPPLLSSPALTMVNAIN